MKYSCVLLLALICLIVVCIGDAKGRKRKHHSNRSGDRNGHRKGQPQKEKLQQRNDMLPLPITYCMRVNATQHGTILPPMLPIEGTMFTKALDLIIDNGLLEEGKGWVYGVVAAMDNTSTPIIMGKAILNLPKGEIHLSFANLHKMPTLEEPAKMSRFAVIGGTGSYTGARGHGVMDFNGESADWFYGNNILGLHFEVNQPMKGRQRKCSAY